MRAVTVKRLAILIAVFSLVGGTGFFAHGFQLDRNAQSRLKQAELAEKAGDFAEAEKLYGEFLAVFPANVDVRIKYANALLKVDKSPRRQNEAIQIYAEIVKQGSLKQTQREDARRRLMQLKIDSLQFKSGPRGDDGADVDLDILLNTSPDDGKLLFLRGRCYEAAGTEKDYEKAEQKYEQAIQHKADQWIEAYQRRAILLRDHLNRPEDAK